MPKKRPEHQKNPAAKAENKEQPAKLSDVPWSEKLIHLFGSLATIGAVYLSALAVTKHWGLITIAVFIAATFSLLGVILKFEHRSRWKWFAVSMCVSALICYGVYFLILKDQAPAEQSQQTISAPLAPVPSQTPSPTPAATQTGNLQAGSRPPARRKSARSGGGSINQRMENSPGSIQAAGDVVIGAPAKPKQ